VKTEPLYKSTSALFDLFPTADQIPPPHRIEGSAYPPSLLLDGKVLPWSGPLTSVGSPIYVRTGSEAQQPIIGHVPTPTEDGAQAALDAALHAWNNGRGPWPRMPLEGRIEAVRNLAASMESKKKELTELLMWEIGKSLEESRAEVDRTIEYIAATLEAAEAAAAGNHATRCTIISAQATDAPIGICLLMGPFNNPVYETYTMLVPALLGGNTTIVKTPKYGVLVHRPLFQSFANFFPPGVVNFIYGSASIDGAAYLMGTGRVDILSFIGSTAAADALVRRHPQPLRLRTILSLGAKNAALVMADADISVAVRECVMGSLAFNGQRCTAIKIIFVHESIVDSFLPEFSSAIDSLPVGMPWEKGVKITPLPEFGKTDLLTSYVEDAVAKGSTVINGRGGERCDTLFRPAVLFPISPEARLYTEEQFGPLVPVRSYRHDGELLDFIASCRYGQQVSIFGRDTARMSELVGNLGNQVGRININCKCQRGPDILPFAGRKDSGLTTLSIRDGLRAFTLPSVVAWRSDEHFG
jgi:glyceraldehyde-3-phosphate dehydrogenase (NADP+)